MKLYFKKYSDAGKPLLILHGLFGNQANWAWHARQLEGQYSVYGVDLRNHGRSSWDERHDYQALADDVLQTMTAIGIRQAHVIGHSMGGKAAMQLALQHPEQVERLVVVDIAPVDYERESFAPLKAMQALDLADLDSRNSAAALLAQFVPEKPVRDFLLTNLVRADNGAFQWRCNLEAIAGAFPMIKGFPDQSGRFAGQVLFIKGGRSDYLLPGHTQTVERLFPHSSFKIVSSAGHWVHSERPQAFLKLVKDFLGR